MFAEVILPLPLYSTFTYSIPQEMEVEVQIGSRVLVQFGKKKYYTAIVEAIHSNPPKGYEVKPVMAVLDSTPIVRYPQLKLWRWIADYYLCSPGEVYKAAVPTGLKPESETQISLNLDYEPDESSPLKLTERQAIIIQTLQQNKRMSISEIEGETGFKNVAAVLNKLLEQGVVEIDEKVVERYRPKKKTFVILKFDKGDSARLHECFGLLTRSRQQEKTLIAYLDLSGWLNANSPLKEVEKDTLLSTAGVSPAVLKALVDKGIMETVRKSVNRFATDDNSSHNNLSPLSPAQKDALNALHEGFANFPIQLLHGVTGSG